MCTTFDYQILVLLQKNIIKKDNGNKNIKLRNKIKLNKKVFKCR